MPGFLYFLPGAKGQATKQTLKRYGLEHVFDPADKVISAEVMRGVSEARGVIIGNGKNFDHTDVKFDKQQKWFPFNKQHAEKQAYCGVWDENDLPGPADLQRTRMLPGGSLTDQENQQWQLPTAHKLDPDNGGWCLPTVYDEDEETGQLFNAKVQRRYQKLWDHAMAYLMAMTEAVTGKGDEAVTFEVPNVSELIVQCYATNYRVSQRECTILELLLNDMVIDVCNILVDSSSIETLKKSPDLDTGNSSNSSMPSKVA